MKRKYFLILTWCLIVLFVNCQSSSESNKPVSLKDAASQVDLQNLDKALQTPKGAVFAFFAALKKSDSTAIRKIVSPRLQRHYDELAAKKVSTFDEWLEDWKKNAEKIQSLGEAPPSQVDGERIEVTNVPVTLAGKDGALTQSRIKVAKYGNLWLWDEN